MLVSHDRALLREVCDEFWLVTAGGVREFDGDLDDYQRWLLEQAREQARAHAQAQKEGAAAAAPAANPQPVPVAAPAVSAAPAPSSREARKAQAEERQRLAARLKPMRQELAQVDQRLARAGEERDR
jgi:ATP-binding cassette subfamily F protein 3